MVGGERGRQGGCLGGSSSSLNRSSSPILSPSPSPSPSIPRPPLPQQVGRMLGDIRHALSAAEVDKVVERTGGYSGSDMRNFIQEACQV